MEAYVNDNRYHLTLEEDLETLYNNKMAAFWRAHATPCDFDGVDGIRIAAMRFVRPASNIGLVISSGRTESLIKYKELIYDLWNQGFSVYIHDHRGQGLSGRILPNEPKKGHVRDFADYVADLKTFVDTVVKPAGHGHLVMLAHSMGGAVASLYLEQHRGDFCAAVLSSPMHEPNTGRISDELACKVLDLNQWLKSPERYAPGKGAYDETESFDDDNGLTHSEIRHAIARQEYARHEQAKLGGPSVGWVIQACEASRQARREADLIEVPVLVIQAGADKVVTPEGQREFFTTMNHARPGSCRLELIPGAYHELFIESDEFRLPALTKALNFIQKACKS